MRTRRTVLVALLATLAIALGNRAPATAEDPSGDLAPAEPPAVDLRLHPFAPSSPWNTLLSADVTYRPADDPAVLNLRDRRAWPYVNASDWSIPVVAASVDDPPVVVTGGNGCLWRPDRLRCEKIEVPHFPVDAIAATGTDGHLVVLDPDGVTAHEFFGMTGEGKTRAALLYVTTDLRGDGLGPAPRISAGSRAFGGSALGGLVRGHELAEGRIPHALAIALANWQLQCGPVWPATTEDEFGCRDDHPWRYSGTIPMGARLAIPPDVDVDTLGLSPHAHTLATALQRYGGYVVDHAADTFALYAEVGAAVDVTAADMRAIQALVSVVDTPTVNPVPVPDPAEPTADATLAPVPRCLPAAVLAVTLAVGAAACGPDDSAVAVTGETDTPSTLSALDNPTSTISTSDVASADGEAGSWTVTSFGEQARPPLVGTNLTLTLEDGRASGSAGCNQLATSFTLEAGALSFGPIATTRMMCGAPEGVMEQETDYVSTLARTAGARTTSDGNLELLDSAGGVIVTLTPAD